MKVTIARLFARLDDVTNPNILEHYYHDVDEMLSKIQRFCINLIKVLVAITILLLVCGESRLMEDAPVMWRIGYEWTKLFHKVMFELTANESWHLR